MKNYENNSRRSFIRKSVSGAIVFGVGLSIPDVFALPNHQKKTIMSDQQKSTSKKVTGIGGIFFKSDDPKLMREWYAKNLGIATTDYGATFDWLEKDDPKKEGSTSWSPFKEDTKYFEPSKKVTGSGGIFFKSDDPKLMREWYAKNLGIATTDYGATFDWLEKDDPKKEGSTSWSPFKEDTKYFEPSKKDFMINYRVEDLEGLVEDLKSNGVTIVDKIEDSPYGKFVHILDLEGNKIELWEPAK